MSVLNNLFQLEIYQDPVDRRRAQNLQGVLLVFIIFSAIAFVASLISAGTSFSQDLLPPLVTIVVMVGALGINNNGQGRVAALLTLGGSVLISSIPIISGDDISAFNMIGLVIPLILASIIVSRTDIIILTGCILVLLMFSTTNTSTILGIDDQTVGTILLLGMTSILGGIAWVIANTFESLRQLTELSKTQKELILTQTSTAITQSILTRLDLENLLTETVEQIREQFDLIYHAQVFLIDDAKTKAILRASTGDVGQRLIDQKHFLPVGSPSVIGSVTKTGEPTLVGDATSSGAVHHKNELLPDTRTELALPLRTSEGIIGALDVQSTQAEAFGESEIETLQKLADQIAIAVENARLYAEAQEETRRAKTLAEASQITGRISSDFESGLSELFRTITAPGQYTHWWFGLMESDGKTLKRVTSHKSEVTAQLIPDIIDVKDDKNSIVAAFNHKSVLIVNDINQQSGFSIYDSQIQMMFGKHIVAPVYSPNTETPIGVVLVGRHYTAPNISERDQELILTVTSQIGIALQNRDLFLQLQQEQQTLQEVLNSMPVNVMVVNRQKELLLINREAQTLFGDTLTIGDTIGNFANFYHTATEIPYTPTELPLNITLTTGKMASAEDLTLKDADGNWVDMLSRATPVYDVKGNITGVVAIYQDISELRNLERALQESLSETTKLYEASRALSHANDVHSVNEAVISQMLTLDPSQIYMTFKKDEIDKSVRSYDDIELALSWPAKDNVALKNLGFPLSLMMPNTRLGTTNLTFATRNLHLLPGIDEPELAVLKDKGIQALAVLPLEARGEIFGSIIAAFEDERHFAPDERRFLLTLADQTSVTLDALRLFKNTQDTLATMSKLYQVSRSISEVKDIEQAFTVVQEQLQVLGADAFDISVLQDQNGFLTMKSLNRWSEDVTLYENLDFLHDDQDFYDLDLYDEIIIENIHVSAPNDPLAKRIHTAEPSITSFVSLPLRATVQAQGRINIAYKTEQDFSEETIRFLRLVADSISYIVENDLLFRQTQDSLEETGILYQAIRAFSNADGVEGILQAIIDYAADPSVDKAFLCNLLTQTWEEENALMEVSVSWVREESINLTGMRFTEDQFPSWEHLSSNKILWVDDVNNEPTLDETARMGYRALDITSLIVVPLRTPNITIGAFVLGSSNPRQHTEREVRVYQSLADQAAIALENIRLYGESESRTKQLEASSQVSQAASSILQLDELLPKTVDLIKQTFDYDHVQVFLMDEENYYALLKASTGEAGRQLLAINHRLAVGSRSVIGQVTQHLRPQIALDTADARVIHKPNPYLPNTRSEMALPLLYRGQILGALDVQSNEPGAFTESDVRILSALADQLAIAIENASLFETTEKRTTEMSFLFNIAVISTTATEIETLVNRINQLIAKQFSADVTMTYLLDSDTNTLVASTFETTLPPETIAKQPSVLTMADQNAIIEAASSRYITHIPEMLSRSYAEHHLSDTNSGIYVPLIAGENLVGVIMIESQYAHHFREDDVNLLHTISNTISAVIRNSQLLDEITRANKRLREVDKLKTDFLAAMSHELRTPLNSVIGFSRVILKGIDGPVTDMQRQDLQTIHDSGKHLLGLVNDILDQAKIEAGKMALDRDYFNLTDIVNGVMSSAKGLTKEKPINTFVEIEPDLPLAYGDDFRTRQILLNLVSNASKFTHEGSITTSVQRIHDEEDKTFIKIAVTDTGIGIAEEDFDKLFASFQQVDNSTTRDVEGTGLGLPLAKSLCELQGGWMDVESEVGIGSTFSFTIPIEPGEFDELEADAEEEKEQQEEREEKLKKRHNIILVEENMDMLNFYRRQLGSRGYDTIGLNTAEEAIEKMMIAQPVAVVINVDINNGWNMLETITSADLPHKVPVIVSSMHDDKARSEKLGAKEHLVRPFSPDDLQELLDEYQKLLPSS